MSETAKNLIAEAIDRAEEVCDPLDDPAQHPAADPNASGNGQTEAATVARGGKPLITVWPGSLSHSVSQAVSALKSAGVQLFDRGGAVYRLVRTEEDSADPQIRRPEGSLHLRLAFPLWLERRLSEVARWQRFDERKQVFKSIDPPSRIAKILPVTSDEDGWPYLRGIVQHPLLTVENRLIAISGYDADTRLLVDLTDDWPALMERPSREEAAAARQRIEGWLRHFPFVSAGDTAVVLSMMLTALIRPTLPSAPAHCIDAPEAGTGKSLLVDATAILATGKTAPVMDYGNDSDEAVKRLDSMLLAGDPIIAIDNVEGPLKGAALCQTLTQESRRVRVLGASVVVTVPCSALITVTGNNLIIVGDMVRRSLVCRLDAGTERPEMRAFDQDLLSEARVRRREIVGDCLTIVSAYAVAGYPDVGTQPLGSFEVWHKRIRNALIWAGADDPVQVMERTRTVDPDREAQRELFVAWSSAFGAEGGTVQDAKKRVGADGELAAAIEKIGALRRGELDARSLGNWLRGKLDSRAGSLVLQKDAGRSRYARWIVAQHGSDGESGESGESVQPDPYKVAGSDTFFALGLSDSPDSPDSPPNGPIAGPAAPCHACKQNRWWDNNGRQTCAVCHPPIQASVEDQAE